MRDLLLQQCSADGDGGCFYDRSCADQGNTKGGGAPCDPIDVLRLCATTPQRVCSPGPALSRPEPP